MTQGSCRLPSEVKKSDAIKNETLPFYSHRQSHRNLRDYFQCDKKMSVHTPAIRDNIM